MFHPGAAFEMRSNKSAGPHGNQCIYDSTGLIITKMPGAGSADWFGPNYSFSGHQGHDVKTYNLAKKLGRVSDYYAVRPVWTE